MRKRKFLSLVAVLTAATTPAQTEPQKSPPLATATPPPNVQTAGKIPADKSPPPPTSPVAQTQGETTTPTPEDKNAPPFDIANMDTSVKPSDDFFMYANGGWIKRTPIPPEYSRWGSFNQLIEKNNDALHDVAERAARETTATDPDAKTAGEHAKKMLTLETSLAQASRTKVELRDPQKNYNKMKTSALQALTPGFKWDAYFKESNLLDPGELNVGQPDFFKGADKVFASTAIDDWKEYFRWHLVHATAAELSADFVNENFNFYETTLRGTQQIKPRWKRVVASTDNSIGEALGKLYVADYFPPESKARMLDLVNNLRSAWANRIKTLEWMDEPTKQAALKKLAAFTVKIGYPDKWRDYSVLRIDRGPYVLNAVRASMFDIRRELNKIGKPVDRTEWGMTPPTVNAYYNPKLNEIVFPAGILQPPFFNPKADDALNYGGIGAVIGHEMTHGFDDQGRQFDEVGNLRDWWTPESAAKFKERSGAIVKQYSEYEPLPGLHVNGELTQGENIADIGGVKIAYAALQKALGGKPQEKIDGFTPEQRFFLGFAQIWRSVQRDEDLKLMVNTNPHSPARYRVNGPLSDLVEFQKAFNLPDNCPMVRPADKKVNIW